MKRKESKIKVMIKDYRELVSLLMRSGDMMDLYVRQNSPGAFADPQRGQGRVMTLLRMAPEVSQKELVYLLGISKQALGEVLSKLENCGYIERHPSESDRRVMMVTLTEKGKEAAEEMNQVQDRSAELFNCLNAEELDNLKDYLERIIASNLDLLPPRHRQPVPGYRPDGYGSGGYGPGGYGFDGYGEYGGRGEGHRPPGPGPEFEGRRPSGPGPEFEGRRPPGPGPDGRRPTGPGPDGYGPDGHRPPQW